MPASDARSRGGAAATAAPAEGRVYGGLTADERRERRRRQLLRAALAVVADRGFAAATVQDVCREAGLSQRYLYEAFADLDELFAAVLDDLAAEVEATLAAAFHGGETEPEDRIRTALHALARFFAEDPRRARVALVESFATPAFRRRRHRSLAAFARLASAELRALRGDARAGRPASDGRAPAGPPDDIDLAVLVLVGGIAEALMASVDGAGDGRDGLVGPPERLVEHLTHLFLAAARTTTPAAPAAGRRPVPVPDPGARP